jgi:hypothetical protein
VIATSDLVVVVSSPFHLELPLPVRADGDRARPGSEIWSLVITDSSSSCKQLDFSKPPSHTTNPIWPLSQRAGGQPGSSSRSSRAQRGQREHRIVPLLPPLRSFLIRDRADRLFFSKSNKKYHYLLIHTPPDWPRPIGAHMEGGRAALGCGTTARTGGLRHLRRRCLPAEAKKQKVGQRRNRGSRISKGTQSRIS